MRGAVLASPRTGVNPENGSTSTAHLARASLGNQHILVLGGGGFLGSAITSALVAHAGRIGTILGPPGTGLLPAPRDVRNGHLDICDMHALASWLRGVDTVVHAAGPPSVAASFADPLAFAQAHVLGTVSTLEACRQAGVRRLVYLSSAEVYGQPNVNPAVESAPLAPLSPYGAAKMSAETFICADAGRSVGDALILRPFSVYGPGSPVRSVVGSIMRQVLAGPEVRVSDPQPIRDYCYIDDLVACVLEALNYVISRFYGPCSLVRSVVGSIMRQVLAGPEVRVSDPRPIRDYCYIDDLVACVLEACASTGGAPVRIYNVGSGCGTSVADLTRHALEVASRQLPLRIVAESDRPARAAVRELVADIGKARRELGWAPSTPLEQGLGQLMVHLRERPS